MRRLRYHLAFLLPLLGLAACGAAPADGEADAASGADVETADAPAPAPPDVRLTWLSVTNWLVEAGDTRILLDGYLTRIDRTLVEADGSSRGTAVTDTAELRRLLAPAFADGSGADEPRIDRIFVGHGHWDHAFDVPALASMTGAGIVGARTVCHQATALGVNADCTPVEGGEVVDVGPHVRVRVVRWHHSGDPTTPAGHRLGAPLELRSPPTVDPETGGLRPGFLDDYPNGGGSRAYLVTVRTADGPVTLFWSNTANPAAWETVVAADTARLRADGVDLSNLEAAEADRPMREALEDALRAEGLEGVDVWLGFPQPTHLRQVLATLRPRAFVPHHWDDFWGPMDRGISRPFDEAAVRPVLDSAGVELMVPTEYYERLVF